MKKIIKLALGGLLACTLFSCAQPTDTPKVEEPKPNDYYFLYDNVYGRDSNNISRTTGYSIVSNITGKEKISEDVNKEETPSEGENGKMSLKDIAIVQDFYFDSDKNLYVLEKQKLDNNNEKSTIKKHEYVKTNNGEYKDPVIIFTDTQNREERSYKHLAVDKDTLYLGCTCDDHHTMGTVLAIYKIEENSCVFKNETAKETYNGLYNTALTIGPNGELYASFHRMSSENKNKPPIVKEFSVNDFTFVEKKSKEIDSITDTYKESILDLQYQDGALYATVAIDPFGFGIIGGGLLKITPTENDFDVSEIYGYRKDGNSVYGDSDLTPYGYPTINEKANFFYSPRKFIAIKPKKLIISDEGYCKAENSNYEDDLLGCNSVVTVDLSKGIPKITGRIIMENVNFNQQETPPSCAYYDKDFNF